MGVCGCPSPRPCVRLLYVINTGSTGSRGAPLQFPTVPIVCVVTHEPEHSTHLLLLLTNFQMENTPSTVQGTRCAKYEHIGDRITMTKMRSITLSPDSLAQENEIARACAWRIQIRTETSRRAPVAIRRAVPLCCA
jgi:hypothetical protein